MRRGSVWMLWSVLLAMSFAGCKDKGGGPKSPEENKGSVAPGGGPTGGPGGDGGRPPELEEALKKYPILKEIEDKVERARAGETVDFANTGASFRMWTDENGAHHTESKGPPHNPYHGTSVTYPDGTYKGTHSNYGDGIIDYQEERGGGRTVKFSRTDKLSKAARTRPFDKRVISMNASSDDFTRVIEQKRIPNCPNDHDEACWETLRDELVPTTVIQRHKQETSDTKPVTTGDAAGVPNFFLDSAQAQKGTGTLQALLGPGDMSWEFRFGMNVIINTSNQSKGQCTSAEADKILFAAADMLNKSLPCLQANHSKMAEAVEKALSRGHFVDFYCGFEGEYIPPSEGTLGFARPKLKDLEGNWICNATFPCTIKINRDYLNAQGRYTNTKPNNIRSTLLHEFLHALGFNVDNPTAHDEGTDETYSCSRYCGGCTLENNGAPEHSSVDCARCADTRERKLWCGHKKVYGLGEPYNDLVCGCKLLDPLGFCGQYAMSCTQNIVEQWLFCDGTIYGVGSSVCCAECPDALPDRPYRQWCEHTVENWEEARFLPIYDGCKEPPHFCQLGRS